MRISLFFSVMIFVFSANFVLYGQQTLSFHYSDSISEQYFWASVRISLVLEGRSLESDQDQVLFLDRRMGEIDLNDFNQVQLALRVEDLQLTESSHQPRLKLELPLEQFARKSFPGLVLAEGQSPARIGMSGPNEGPQKDDILFNVQTSQDQIIQGVLPVSFDLLWQDGKKEHKETVLSFKYSVIPRATTRTDEKKMITFVGESEKKTNKSLKDTSSNKSDISYSSEERKNDQRISTGSSDQVNTTENRVLQPNPQKQIEDNSVHGLTAEARLEGNNLTITNIKQGKSPFSLFFLREEPEEPAFELALGRGRSFTVDLSRVPIDDEKYTLRLNDGEERSFVFPESIDVNKTSSATQSTWPWKWIGIGLGGLSLIITVIWGVLKRNNDKLYPITDEKIEQ